MDIPVQQLVEQAELAISKMPGSNVFFKWTCRNCGSRQTFEEPNKLYTSGICEECKHETKIIAGGFLLVTRIPRGLLDDNA